MQEVEHSGKKPKSRRSWPGLVLVIGAGLLPVLGEFGRLHWLLDLFSHFQAQYFIFIALCGLLLFIRGQRRSAIVAAVFLILPAVRLAPLWIPPAPKGEPDIRVATFNVLGSNTRYAETLDWIRREQPDVVYLCEPTPAWVEALQPLAELYPHRVENPKRGNIGFVLFSRFPIRDTRITEHGAVEVPLVAITVEFPSGPVRVFGAHPLPPISGFWAGEHTLYFEALVTGAAASDTPTLILGDLNATRWGRRGRELIEAGFEDAAVGRGYRATWSRSNPLFAIPIDLILSRDLGVCVEFGLGPDLGSDHRPVIAGFQASSP
ncbi:endonuclease/exonuclease/phosphatase family protein [Haloferula sp. A504]|uniref:endonuclease/exonuclease/phosphatase family protein n=1 Tax=Haloferula sp. A504 TaxID=3373601 RepID=UPI0031C396DC|nr:endonuclease/exonuclease/phosphatase family protein [Verrucomicrobiaceae bacterium E54]